MIHAQSANHCGEETTIYQSVEDVDTEHTSELGFDQTAHSTITTGNQFGKSVLPDCLKSYYASPNSSIYASPASPGSPFTAAMPRYACEIANAQDHHLSSFDPFVSRPDTSGETISWEPSQDTFSPRVQEIDEFLDFPETDDMSINGIPTTEHAIELSPFHAEDVPSTLRSYVPVQARPLISYTEHQQAIYSEYFQYSHEPIGFDMSETTETAVSDTSCDQSDNCVCHDFIDADELYDMSLEENNFFHFDAT